MREGSLMVGTASLEATFLLVVERLLNLFVPPKLLSE